MKGRVVLITGATSGIGKETAIGLARMGATLVLVGRDPEKARQVSSEIAEKTGNRDVLMLLADLSSMKEVRRLAEEVIEKVPRLDVLVNNAGGIFMKRQITADGYEMTFALNHLSPFHLTNLLLDLLRKSVPSRIVTVASMGHFMAHIDFNDLMGEKRYGWMRAYNRSKLANVLFTYELARRLKGTGVFANCLHPGPVASNFGKGQGWFGLLMKIGAPFILPPEQGAKNSIFVASSPEVEGISGKYFYRLRASRSSRESYDEEVATRLWKISEEYTGLTNR